MIRHAAESDLPRILEIYDIARQFMRQSGNMTQWVNGYPSEPLLRQDIMNGNLYVMEDEGGVYCVFALVMGDDPTYAEIEGAWQDTATPYGTIHRIGSDGTPEFAAKESQQAMYDQIMPLLARFDDIRFLTGHNHRFINIPLTDRIFQHTLVSASAVSWKINGPESRLVSEDGSPGGYLILRYRGGRADWQFKPNGYRADRNQFRVYDLNRVPEEFGGQPGSNRCLINVYNWDERWTVRVRENGRDLKVEQVWAKDPLYILIRRDALPTRPTAFRAVANPHMFAVEASAPDTPLEVTVTDRFGRKYRQTVERPKRFDWRTE